MNGNRLSKLEKIMSGLPSKRDPFICVKFSDDRPGIVHDADDIATTYTEDYLREYHYGLVVFERPVTVAEARNGI